MSNFQQKAYELFKEGFSCSESVVRAAQESGYIDAGIDIEFLNKVVSPFSGSMGGSGCLCGAVAGAQVALGVVFGRNDYTSDPNNVREMSKKLAESFKNKRKATCCKVLTAKYKNSPIERRNNCAEIVKDVVDVLEKIVKEKLSESESLFTQKL